MKHEMHAEYPAPKAVVLRMFCDRDFHERKLAKMGVSEFEVLECESTSGQFHIRVARQVPVQIPGMKKSGGSSRVVHAETWSLADGTARVTAEPQGMPLTMTCEARIEEKGDESCVVHYSWEVTCRVPVVGRKIERFVVGDMDVRAEEEAEAGRQLLSDYR